MMDRAFSCLALLGALALSPRPAAAQTAASDPEASRRPETTMRYDLTLDLSITLAATVTWATLELLTPTLSPPCRWCDRHSGGSDALNGFDSGIRNALRWKNTKTADTLSTVFSFGLAPAAGIGVAALITWQEHRMDELPADILVVAESAMLASMFDDIVKLSVARERPDVHARTPEERARLRKSSDNLSFFSGHATLAFALAVSAGTIATMRHHKLAWLMWASGLALASTGAYLRIAADRHYASDVLVGMLFGSAVGFVVPYYFHRPRSGASAQSARLSAMPLPGGAALGVSGVF